MTRSSEYVIDRSRFGSCDLCGRSDPNNLRPWRVQLTESSPVFTSHMLCPSCYAKWFEGARQVREAESRKKGRAG